MVSGGLLNLDVARALDEAPVTAAFCFGSHRLYDWVDHNPCVQILRTERPGHVT